MNESKENGQPALSPGSSEDRKPDPEPKPEEMSIPLAGWTSLKKGYFVEGIIVCTVLGIILYIFKIKAPLPFIVILISLFAEWWWADRKLLKFTFQGLSRAGDPIPWEKISRYTIWGPVGIPLTPIQLQGMILYLVDGKTLSVSSRAPGYQPLLDRLSQLKLPAPEMWHHYPRGMTRVLRYLAALGFGVFLVLLVFFAKFVLVVAAVAVVYWVFRNWRKSRKQHRKVSQKYFWMVGITLVLAAGISFFVFKGLLENVAVVTVPVLVILWFPWRFPPVALFHDALFVGKRKAYPLRHLRTWREESKFFVLKFWRISFANGDVDIWPFLENFQHFKKQVEQSHERVRIQQQEKPSDPEQNIIRSPREEAQYIKLSHPLPS